MPTVTITKRKKDFYLKNDGRVGRIAEKLVRGGMLVEHDLARLPLNGRALAAYDEDPTALNKLISYPTEWHIYLLRRHATKKMMYYTHLQENLSEESKNWINEETKALEEQKLTFQNLKNSLYRKIDKSSNLCPCQQLIGAYSKLDFLFCYINFRYNRRRSWTCHYSYHHHRFQ